MIPAAEFALTPTEIEREVFELLADKLAPQHEVDPDEINLRAPTKFRFLETTRARYKVLYGGRGGGKSWQIARALLKKGAQRSLRILCAREFQNSMRDSVLHLLEEQIEYLGLDEEYDVQQSVIKHRRNGTMFIFKGLRRHVQEIKSTEGIDICWVEEAQSVSAESWRVLVPTVREDDSEIWVSFNPMQDTDPTYVRFVKKSPPDAIVRYVTYKDNPWLTNVLRNEAEHLRRVDPEAYAHVWLGETWSKSEAQILNGLWEIDDLGPARSHWHGPYFGMDFGFAQDPSTLVKLYVVDRTLYVRNEAGGVGIPNTRLKDLFTEVPESEEHLVRADNARPETINHLVEEDDLNVVGCRKWRGSVEDGISHLRSYDRIVLHPSCKRTAQECRLYRYKTDKLTGDVIRKIIDQNNHYIDAIRYALEPVIVKQDEDEVKEFFFG